MQTGIESRIQRRSRLLTILLVAFTVLLSAAPAQAAPVQAPVADGTVIYIVRPGDRLGDIAARYGTSVSAIVRANGLASADVIYPGQRLTIPTGSSSSGSGSSAAPAKTPKYHTVQAGETLAKIAQKYGVSASAISQANGITNADLIRVGQRLLIPGSSGSTGSTGSNNPPDPKPTGQTIYVVQAGDTLGQIAKRYGTTVQALVDTNGLGSPDRIRVGMRLAIPKGGSAPSYPGQATRMVVSISQQRCWLYRGDTVIAKWVCSTGRKGSGTKVGTFRIQSKMPKAYGSRWDIWMPYWLGIYWAGGSENGIHGLPWKAKTGNQIWSGYVGTPITYGCVMLDNVNAKMLYDMSYIGMPVVVRP